MMRSTLRAALRRWGWRIGTWLAAKRRLRARPQDVHRQLYRTQTRGMGVRVTEWLRNRLRPGWLRLHPGEPKPPNP